MAWLLLLVATCSLVVQQVARAGARKTVRVDWTHQMDQDHRYSDHDEDCPEGDNSADLDLSHKLYLEAQEQEEPEECQMGNLELGYEMIDHGHYFGKMALTLKPKLEPEVLTKPVEMPKSIKQVMVEPKPVVEQRIEQKLEFEQPVVEQLMTEVLLAKKGGGGEIEQQEALLASRPIHVADEVVAAGSPAGALAIGAGGQQQAAGLGLGHLGASKWLEQASSTTPTPSSPLRPIESQRVLKSFLSAAEVARHLRPKETPHRLGDATGSAGR